MMCCKLPHIEELEKPAGRWCRHAVTGKGCGIYESRPQICRRFYCQWMIEPDLGPGWKPDKAKFLMSIDPSNEAVLRVTVDPAFPDAWTKPPFLAGIKDWVAREATLGRFAIVQIGSRVRAILPDRIVELGDLESGFFLMRQRDPTGKTIDVRVKTD
jgi:hypothetical protein